jgi:hypothetical protein
LLSPCKEEFHFPENLRSLCSFHSFRSIHLKTILTLIGKVTFVPKNRMLSDIIKQKIEKRFGKAVVYSKDCEALAATISSECKEHISGSTLKRLYGFVKGTEQARQSTLDVIAKYLDSPNWEMLIKSFDNASQSEFITLHEISIEQLDMGKAIELGYFPNRRLYLKYLGKQQFEVFRSENSKLANGDILTAFHFVLGYPLLIENVKRNGKDLGQYIAGKSSGLTHISYREE